MNTLDAAFPALFTSLLSTFTSFVAKYCGRISFFLKQNSGTKEQGNMEEPADDQKSRENIGGTERYPNREFDNEELKGSNL